MKNIAMIETAMTTAAQSLRQRDRRRVDGDGRVVYPLHIQDPPPRR